jgi:hypothetical protein
LDLRTPFGVYSLLHELTAASRRVLGTDRLLVWWASSGGRGGGFGKVTGPGLRTGLDSSHVKDWATARGLLFDPPPPHDADDTVAGEDVGSRSRRR